MLWVALAIIRLILVGNTQVPPWVLISVATIWSFLIASVLVTLHEPGNHFFCDLHHHAFGKWSSVEEELLFQLRTCWRDGKTEKRPLSVEDSDFWTKIGAVEALSQREAEKNLRERDSCLAELQRIRPRVISGLLAAFCKADHYLRKKICQRLDQIGWLPAKDNQGADYWIAKEQFGVCVTIGPEAIPALGRFVNDVNRSVEARVEATRALGRIHHGTALTRQCIVRNTFQVFAGATMDPLSPLARLASR